MIQDATGGRGSADEDHETPEPRRSETRTTAKALGKSRTGPTSSGREVPDRVFLV